MHRRGYRFETLRRVAEPSLFEWVPCSKHGARMSPHGAHRPGIFCQADAVDVPLSQQRRLVHRAACPGHRRIGGVRAAMPRQA